MRFRLRTETMGRMEFRIEFFNLFATVNSCPE